jgi:IS30 family transposase
VAQIGRPGLSTSQKAEMWRRWKRSESHSGIGRALGKQPASIHGTIRIHGGIAPLPRKRSARALSWEEREEISRGIAAGDSMRAIAVSIGRATSTVSREIARNGGTKKYRASLADEAAWDRARRPKCCRLATVPRLRHIVSTKLRMNWSPEQISGWLKREYPNEEDMQVSHETIYRTLFIQARGALKKELLAHLRTRRKMRRSQKASTRDQPRGQHR